MKRVVFMGSPALAIPSLKALQSYWAAHPGEIQVTGVFTQPDKPAGRRRKLTPCPVKQAALDMGLEVLTPLKSGGPDALEALARWRPDFVVVCAYGKLLPRRVLDVPPLGCFNLHFSLLPRWRGASPIQAAILAGDTATGVSLQRMVMQLDAGPVVLEAPAAILPDDTAGALGQRLAELSGELLTRALPDVLEGGLSPRPQDESAVTLCHTIRKEDGALRWDEQTAEEIVRRVRGFTPWPGCHGWIGGKRLVILKAENANPPLTTSPHPPLQNPVEPGVLLEGGWVACKSGWVRLMEVKPEGRGAMAFQAFANGHPQALGQAIRSSPA